jgi:predicted CopG family antitoxin
VTKPVALSDETYRKLKKRKQPGESFSQVIERLMREQKKDPMLFVQHVPKSRVPAERRLQEIQDDRESSWEDA